MEIRLRETGQIVSDNEFRSINFNTSFPAIITQEILDSFNADIVLEGPYPSHSISQYVYRDGTIQIDGMWYKNYSIADKNEEVLEIDIEEGSKNTRITRNEKLKACDWTQLPDSPVNKEAWASYRQALRDITSQEGFPYNVTWPEAPG